MFYSDGILEAKLFLAPHKMLISERAIFFLKKKTKTKTKTKNKTKKQNKTKQKQQQQQQQNRIHEGDNYL